MRAHHTYRAERRNDWRKLDGVTWLEHNRVDGKREFSVGFRPPRYPEYEHRSAVVARSKYMPHIGAKERGRYANVNAEKQS